jgi:beta-N-acetylhexosaminidase
LWEERGSSIGQPSARSSEQRTYRMNPRNRRLLGDAAFVLVSVAVLSSLSWGLLAWAGIVPWPLMGNRASQEQLEQAPTRSPTVVLESATRRQSDAAIVASPAPAASPELAVATEPLLQGTGSPVPKETSSPPVAASSPLSRPAGRQIAVPSERSIEDRVGQLLLLGWPGSSAQEAISTLAAFRPAGLVYVQNVQLASEATVINLEVSRWAAQNGLPSPILAIDHEGGRVQRLRDLPNLGSNADFAATTPSDRQACERGRAHGQQLRAAGFTMSLAPDLDVNLPTGSPAIGDRSYGNSAELVARLGSSYIRGLQGLGVTAVAKHFPGHGSATVDSHFELPLLTRSAETLRQVDLLPFRRVAQGSSAVMGIMSAHLVAPTLDPSEVPATLSPRIMSGILRDELGFQGVAVSDDLGAMRAITDSFTPEAAAVQAVRAGVDLLIISGDMERQRRTIQGLIGAVRSGEITQQRVEQANARVDAARQPILQDPRSAVCG